jgi:hypothetical protein
LLNCYGVRCRLIVNKVDHYKESARSIKAKRATTRGRVQQARENSKKHEKSKEHSYNSERTTNKQREPPDRRSAPRLFKCLSEASKEKWSKAERS